MSKPISKIAIIGGNQRTRKSCQIILQNAGYQVAEEEIEQDKMDLVIEENKSLRDRFRQKQEEIEKNVNRTQDLLSFVNELNNSLNFTDLTDRLRANLCNVLGVKLYSIFLYDRKTKVLQCLSSTHLEDSLSFPIGLLKGSVMEEVIKGRKMIVSENFSDSNYQRNSESPKFQKYAHANFISMPLFSGRRLIGILNLNDKSNGENTFNEHDIRLISIFGENLAPTLHNHILLDELKQKILDLDTSLLKLKETQENLVQSEKLAALSIMVAGLAHEIKNPLNAMSLTVENLEEVLQDKHFWVENKDGEESGKCNFNLRKYICMLRAEITRLKKLTDNFLDFTRPIKVETEPINIKEAIQSALLNLEPEIVRSGISVNTHFNDRQAIVLGDPNGLHRVFVNLILNAIQALKKGGIVEITTFVKKNQALITIRDTGVGIQKEYLSKVFDPFFTTKPEGVGLGLSLVYRTVRAMGGSIKLASTEGKWTEVRLSFSISPKMTQEIC